MLTDDQSAFFYNSIINDYLPTFMRFINPSWWQSLWYWRVAVNPSHIINHVLFFLSLAK